MPGSKPLQGKMRANGQTPMEVIGIAVIFVGLLLLVFATTYSRNAETEIVLETGENSINPSRRSAI